MNVKFHCVTKVSIHKTESMVLENEVCGKDDGDRGRDGGRECVVALLLSGDTHDVA